MIFDRPALRRHRNRAAPHVDRVAPVLQEVAERLLDRLEDTESLRALRPAVPAGARD